MFSRRDVLGAMVGALIATGPLAALAQAEDPAVAAIKSFYDAVQSATTGPQADDPKARFDALSDPVTRTFDLGAMTRLVVGPPWSKIPPAKQAALQDAFGRYFIANYANRLGAIKGGRFEVSPKPDQRSTGKLVRTKVFDAAGRETPVDFLVNADNKVVDLYLSGTVSELAALRALFDQAFKSGGADGLEAEFRQRADKILAAK